MAYPKPEKFEAGEFPPVEDALSHYSDSTKKKHEDLIRRVKATGKGFAEDPNLDRFVADIDDFEIIPAEQDDGT